MMTTSTEYSDDLFRNALRALNDAVVEATGCHKETFLHRMRKSAPSAARDQKKSSLLNLAALLKDGRRSGLELEPVHWSDVQKKADSVPWSAASAEALIHAVGDSDLEAVRAVVRRCEHFRNAIEAVLSGCAVTLHGVNAELDREDGRIAQIAAARDAKKLEQARPCREDVALLRRKVDQFDNAARQVSAAANVLRLSRTEITEYLLVDSALAVAREIVGKAPLRPEDVSAQSELNGLRVAVDRVNSALGEAIKVVEHENARVSEN